MGGKERCGVREGGGLPLSKESGGGGGARRGRGKKKRKTRASKGLNSGPRGLVLEGVPPNMDRAGSRKNVQ